MSRVIYGFLPWIVFSIFFGNSPQEVLYSTLIASIVFLAVSWKQLLKGFVLTWGTAIFLLFTWLFGVVYRSDWVINNIWFISSAFLASIVWFSLIINKPFTLQYAKLTTPEFFWQKQGFLRVNQILTVIWGILITISALVNLIPFKQINLPEEILYQVTSYGFILLGMWLNVKLPKWYTNIKRKKLNRKNPYLQGNFAPIRSEDDFKHLPMKGKIPTDLRGVYMRNGPNPAFEPISYRYPFDGDGMLHAMYLSERGADYRNRYVKTKGLLLEQKYGHAIYGGILMPVPIDPKIIGPNDDPGPIKDGAFIHIIKHANKYLAMWEGGPAYEVTRELDTIGEWHAGMPKPIAVAAHTRKDSATGDLYLINYDLQSPYLQLLKVDAEGQLQQTINIEKSYSTMIHDFVITENYIIIFDCPAVLDMQAMMQGGDVLQWRPEYKTNIFIIVKNQLTAPPRKLTTKDAFFVFHFANAFEQNQHIIIDYVRHESIKLEPSTKPSDKPPKMARMQIDLQTEEITETILGQHAEEFPTFNLAYTGKPYRYAYTVSRLNYPNMRAVVKHDLIAQSQTSFDFGAGFEVGEAAFAAKLNTTSEDDGYLLMFVYDKAKNRSEFVILNAKDLTMLPLAKIALPRRVPTGLHGSWFAENK